MGQNTSSCFQRCVILDGSNALYTTTYEIDKKYGTSYAKNFENFMIHIHQNDFMVSTALTDPKGDRSIPPGQQPDPDMYIHVVEKKA